MNEAKLFAPILAHTLGFNPAELFDAKPQTYPPYNIFRLNSGNKLDFESNVFVDVGVSGFSKEELSVTMNNGVLLITGKRKQEELPIHEYTHRGLAQRDFSLKFNINSSLKVESVKLNLGILRVELSPVSSSVQFQIDG